MFLVKRENGRDEMHLCHLMVFYFRKGLKKKVVQTVKQICAVYRYGSIAGILFVFDLLGSEVEFCFGNPTMFRFNLYTLCSLQTLYILEMPVISFLIISISFLLDQFFS